MLLLITMRASLFLRVVARSIDLVIVLAAVEASSHVGWLAGFIYLLIGDSLMEGASLGKKLTGLHVRGEKVSAPEVIENSDEEVIDDHESQEEAYSPEGSHKCTPRESVLRNAPFAVGMILWRVIPFLGWIIMLGILVLEFLVLLGSANGKRIGDELAQTTVVLIDDPKED